MKATQFIEKYFGIFLAIGLISGLVYPVFNDFLLSTLKPFLMVMLFLVMKKYLPGFARGRSHLFSSINIFLLSLMVYAIMGSQRGVILGNPEMILWQTGFLYLVFILLHIFGFLIGYGQDKKGRIATAVSAAYMNNSMAIVLAAVYFGPSILVLMVLSEIPWNTLLMPFRKIANWEGQEVTC